ncbi:twin-arginine translocation signal domain-containing protein [Haloarcula salinisoli]|uniref:Twin-arginine translocation signal domain-containing protein n=1 Tax=Haloarcula salinisoli TaxID=2487746 RepID=A0A8J7YGB1_9EURY|nr:twin-arginine translocation signal domain-containing protein [Halomicroarcula salinisoli]MBX0287456.1 twin-arginine translocation signal domain-containing protein [Halomicroarcula salinisoli]MBX0304972.1 twin-arginine translocation signal domain-containing protein [Halomicroarcula salinisoli]
MTDDTSETLLDRIDDSRRDFMKKGALATGALALGASGTAAAQEDDDGLLEEDWQALIFISNFHPNGRFVFVSDVVEFTPNYGDVQDSFFTDYNTYQIRWLDTDEVVPLFVAEDAPIGSYDEDLGFIPDDDQNQPQVYEVDQEWSPFGDNERLVTLDVSPLDEDDEDALLDTQDWWQESDDATNGTPTDDNTTNGT